MNSLQPGAPAVVITRVAPRHWHALEDDLVVGRGEALPRPDGRIFLSIDAWRAPVTDRLAAAMLAALPRPLYTVVDAADRDLRSHWARAGFTLRRREWEYLLPTDPEVTGLDATPPPGGALVPVGEADETRLRALDETVRAEVGGAGMPAEVLPRLDGATLRDPSRYAAAALCGEYVGLLRLTGVPRRPRLGLIAVRADQRRRGVARALLALVLGALHQSGTAAVSADVAEANHAAVALVDGVGGARRAGSTLELVRR